MRGPRLSIRIYRLLEAHAEGALAVCVLLLTVLAALAVMKAL